MPSNCGTLASRALQGAWALALRGIGGLMLWAAALGAGAAGAPLVSVADALNRLTYLAERHPEQAAQAAQALRARAGSLSPAQSLQLTLAETTTAVAQVRVPQALEGAELAVATASRLGEQAMLAEAMALRGSVRMMLGDDDGALADVTLAAERAAGLSLPSLAVLTRALLVVMYAERADFQNAFLHLGQAESMAHSGADALARARVAEAQALLSRRLGDWDGAMTQLQRGRELFRETGHALGTADLTRLMGTLLREQERWPEALPLLDEALQSARLLNDAYGVGLVQSVRSVVLAALGRPAEAEAASREALAAVNAKDYVSAQLVVLLDRVELQSRLGATAEVLSLIAEVRRRAVSEKDIAVQLRLRRTLSDAYDRMGRPREALVELREHNKLKDRRDAQRVQHQLAALRGQLQSMRITSENELLRRDAEASRQLIHANERTSRFRAALAAVLAFLGALLLVLLWRTVRNSRRLRMLASTDPLTGALNRRSMAELGRLALQRRRLRGGDVCVLMLDLDHFKRINDIHGHPAGDRTLVAVAREIRRHLRAADHLCRYGGEEFLVLLAGTPVATARAVGERVRESVKALAEAPQGVPQPITISLGLACATADDTDFAALVSRADQALYESKRAGRDRLTEFVPEAAGHAPRTALAAGR